MSEHPLVRSLPLAMLLVFVAFWSGWDLALGLWIGLVPSGLVLVTLAARAHSRRGEP